MRLLPKMLLALACAAALTGCANSTTGQAERAGGDTAAAEQPANGGGPAPSSTGSAGGSSAAAPSESELLTSAELPGNPKVQKLDIASMTEQIGKAAQQATFEPAECGKLGTAVFDQMRKQGTSLQGVAMVAGSASGAISEAILSRPADFTLNSDESLLRKCRTVKTTIAGMNSTTRIAPVDLSGIDADETFGYKQEMNMGGTTIHTISASMATSNRVVTVALSGPSEQSAGDIVALANKALAKVGS